MPVTDPFELISQLGRGGMGVVWKARDVATQQVVAVKLLHSLFADDADYVARFEREVELGRRVDSPNVVKVLGFGRREGVPFLAMEYVDGPSLKEKLKEHGPYTWAEAKPLLLQVALGLEAAHAAGIVHRDVKPSNVLLAPDGTAKLADFGIARANDVTSLTASSVMLGTAAYMALEGQRDERSDLYSLGCVAYEMLVGRTPYEGGTPHDVVAQQMKGPPALSVIEDGSARKVVAWLLAREPRDRPQTASALVAVLEGSSRAPSVSRERMRKPVLAGVAAAAVALIAAAGVVVGLANSGGGPAGTSTPAASTTARVVERGSGTTTSTSRPSTTTTPKPKVTRVTTAVSTVSQSPSPVITKTPKTPDVSTPVTSDSDNDGVADNRDACPRERGTQSNGCPPPRPADRDGDGVADSSDNCTDASNSGQADSDGDGHGDACDTYDNRDNDRDGVANGSDTCPNQSGTQGNGCPVPDRDNDRVPDSSDNCPDTSNSGQSDSDSDGHGDACDNYDNRDNDRDGVANGSDSCPNEFGTQSNGCPPPQVTYQFSASSPGTLYSAGDTMPICYQLSPANVAFTVTITETSPQAGTPYQFDGSPSGSACVNGTLTSADIGHISFSVSASVNGVVVGSATVSATVSPTGGGAAGVMPGVSISGTGYLH